jgi:hypothetical protein
MTSSTFCPSPDTGWAAPMWVPGAMAATSAAMVIRNPAEAARDPDGPTNTATGVCAAMMALLMSRVESTNPPGVRKTITSTAAFAASAWARALRTYSTATGWMMPSTSMTNATGAASCRAAAAVPISPDARSAAATAMRANRMPPPPSPLT